MKSGKTAESGGSGEVRMAVALSVLMQSRSNYFKS